MGAIQVHCVMEGTSNIQPSPSGVSGAVRVLTCDGLSCLVSDCDGVAMTSLPREDLVRRLLAHQSVIEQVMGSCTVLPVKFGTILASAQETQDMLAQGREQLLSALAAMRDKVEIEVAATWDIHLVLGEASRDEEVVRARESIAQKGVPTFEDRLRLGQVVKACLDQRRNSYRERMVGYLQPLAIGVAAHALVSDRMVMNVAFLVAKARQSEFDEGVKGLDELFHSQITFRIVGPLPPYSFSTVEVVRVDPGQLEAARRVLGLGDASSTAEVRRAYRHAVARLQRRLTSEEAAAGDGLATLRRASDLLLAYCRGQDTAGKGPPDATRTGGGVFLITIKGTREDEVEPARFGQVGAALPAGA